MARVGAKIFRRSVTFLKNIFLRQVEKESVGDILVVGSNDKLSSSTYLSTSKNKLSVGSVTQDTFEIQGLELLLVQA